MVLFLTVISERGKSCLCYQIKDTPTIHEHANEETYKLSPLLHFIIKMTIIKYIYYSTFTNKAIQRRCKIKRFTPKRYKENILDFEKQSQNG